jgi:hypothetical protein
VSFRGPHRRSLRAPAGHTTWLTRRARHAPSHREPASCSPDANPSLLLAVTPSHFNFQRLRSVHGLPTALVPVSRPGQVLIATAPASPSSAHCWPLHPGVDQCSPLPGAITRGVSAEWL